MARTTRKRFVKDQVSRDLREAARLLRQAAGKLIRAADARERIAKAQVLLGTAEKLAHPTTYSAREMSGEPKTKRDGLPYGVRRSLETEARHLADLAKRVDTTPVTKDEKLLKERK